MLLGHFCSMITSLHLSKDGQYIATTDRDNKVRVSNMPATPAQVGKPCLDPVPAGHLPVLHSACLPLECPVAGYIWAALQCTGSIGSCWCPNKGLSMSGLIAGLCQHPELLHGAH